MSWVMVAAAAVTVVGSVVSSKIQSKSVKDASKASTEGTNKVLELGAPYRAAGTDALAHLADPNKFFTASPGYQWRLNQGIEAVNQNKAVNSLLRSGSTLKAVNDYAQGSASSEYDNWWRQNFNMGQLGFNATGLGSQAIQTNTANQGNAAIAGGNNTAATVGAGTDLIGGLIAKYGGQIGSKTGQSSYGGADFDPYGLNR